MLTVREARERIDMHTEDRVEVVIGLLKTLQTTLAELRRQGVDIEVKETTVVVPKGVPPVETVLPMVTIDHPELVCRGCGRLFKAPQGLAAHVFRAKIKACKKGKG